MHGFHHLLCGFGVRHVQIAHSRCLEGVEHVQGHGNGCFVQLLDCGRESTFIGGNERIGVQELLVGQLQLSVHFTQVDAGCLRAEAASAHCSISVALPRSRQAHPRHSRALVVGEHHIHLVEQPTIQLFDLLEGSLHVLEQPLRRLSLRHTESTASHLDRLLEQFGDVVFTQLAERCAILLVQRIDRKTLELVELKPPRVALQISAGDRVRQHPARPLGMRMSGRCDQRHDHDQRSNIGSQRFTTQDQGETSHVHSLPPG